MSKATPETLTLTDFQRLAAKGDKLSGNVAALLRCADLGGWIATLNLQARKSLSGTGDAEIMRVAVREALWHLAAVAAKLNVPLADVAGEALEISRGG